MRLGLRMQLLLLLGGLICLTFVPLYFAIDTYSQVGLYRTQTETLTALARQVNGHVADSRPELDETRLLNLLSAEVQGGAVRAIYALDSELNVLARAGAPELIDFEPAQLAKSVGHPLELQVPTGEPNAAEQNRAFRTLAIGHRGPEGVVVSIVQLGRTLPGAALLSRIMALYMSVSALIVLIVSYFAVTRWFVEPTILLLRRAERVREGGRRLDALERAPAELVALSQAVGQMTEALLNKEAALARKVEEVERTAEELKSAQASLVRSERLASVGRLAAGLAHEIGNPITALMGILDLLLEGGLERAEEVDFLQRMRRETGRIHRVLKDLLAYARAEPRHLPHAHGELLRAVHDVVELLRPQKRFSEIEIETELGSHVEPVPLSHEEIMQVCLNLLMNAADAMEGKGKIVVHTEQTPSEVRLTVTDTGPGIPPQVSAHIFEPFFSTKDVGQGTGLGLSVTRGLVEASGGTLLLDETYQAGARFVATWQVGLRSR
jgi:two-component system, NtrC family, sensor kinase